MFANPSIPLSLAFFLLCIGQLRPQAVALQSEIKRPSGSPFFIPVENAADKGGWVLENESTGAVLPLQAYNPTQLVGLLETPLAASERRLYRLRPGKGERAQPGARAAETNGMLVMLAGEKEVLRYALAEQWPPDSLPGYYWRSGFIHPLRSPSGIVVTDGFPAGHAHQHGIFMAWVNTLFRGKKVDFWNQQNETGTVGHWMVDTLISGPVFAEAIVRLRHHAFDFGPVLEEEWTVRVFNNTAPFIWEADSRQVNITEDTLHVLGYHYGGMGIRGSRYWNPDDESHFYDTARVLAGAGDTRQAANHSHPGWVALYGYTPSGLAGIAAIDHPGNFRYPQSVRVHPEMPYFCFAPVADGGFSLAPGAPYHSRYRFLVFDGPPDAEALGLFGRDFGAPMIGEF